MNDILDGWNDILDSCVVTDIPRFVYVPSDFPPVKCEGKYYEYKVVDGVGYKNEIRFTNGKIRFHIASKNQNFIIVELKNNDLVTVEIGDFKVIKKEIDDEKY